MLHRFLAPLALGALIAAAGCRTDETTTSSTGGTTSSGTGGGGGQGGGGEGGSAPGTALRVMNWNTRNFFNDVDDSTADGEVVLTPAQYDAKRKAVGAVIKALDPDIAVLQEVENIGVLDELDELELDGAYPNRALVESTDPRGIDIGAISKIPFDSVVSHKDDQFTKVGTQGPIYTFARDAIEFHVSQNGRHVILIGVHYRSKGPPDDPDKRLAEAQRSRAIADELAAADPTAAITILGDFNDVPGSPPVVAVQGSGEAAFEDAADQVASAGRWTYDFNGSLELVDHQMMNPVLRSMLQPASVKIPHDATIDAAGDHAPILAVYGITPP
ncbi:MAG: endonuclease/exonuclease/phosphatase family protein [Polyangiaceae bacterium]|nr:endonuclease/exonuclease/phosphatase family protein [Polyangiaceae bacterium]